MNVTGFNPFTMAQSQFHKVADLLDLDSGTRDFLQYPQREYEFSLPIRRDDDQIAVYRGFRVQHNNARGPAKGGIRFHPEETIDTIRALAMWSTWKCAVVNIPLGGSYGGVICDPHNISTTEMERICRGWVRCMLQDCGPNIDVPEPDIMATPQHMLWMLDEYEGLLGEKSPGFITGKPVELGGSLGQREAAGCGLVYILREALKELNLSPSQASASIQGFGNVAQSTFRLFQQIGGTVKCVSCWDQEDQKAYAFVRDSGIDFNEMQKITDFFGGINKNKAENLGFRILPGEDWISQDVDILIPAAIENQITIENINKISPQVKIIAEGANGPTSPEADKIIADKGIFLIPDLLANSGGAICSYFEQVQNNMNFYWQSEEIMGKLDVKITNAYYNVFELAQRNTLNMRDASYMIAIGRVAQACQDRGWI